MTQQPIPIADADLHAFVDGQMDFERRAVLAQAMAADPEARAKAEQWRRQNEALTATFGAVLREPLPLRLMPGHLARHTMPRGAKPALAPVPSAPDQRARGAAGRLLAVAGAAFVAGGALVFVADAYVSNPGLISGAEIESIYANGAHALAVRAYEAHRTYAGDLNHPVEIPASEGDHLLDWIQHRLSMPVRIPDLRPQGWTLIGGRVLPGEVGPAAFLVYGNGIDRLGLYIARTNVHQGDVFSVYDNGAGLGSVGYWIDEPVGYAITTNRDGTWLDRNGMDIHQAIRVQARDNATAE